MTGEDKHAPMRVPHACASDGRDHNEQIGAPTSEFTGMGLLCDSILNELNVASGFSDTTRLTVATLIGNILSLHKEVQGKAKTASKRAADLKRQLIHTKEQLAVLRQKHFDKSSEKTAASADEDQIDFSEEDELAAEAKMPLRGKQSRKVGSDINITTIDHYPSDMTCTGCGHELKSIKAEKRVGRLQIIPERVEVVQDVYHTCACNREACKDNKPILAKSSNYIMRGRSMAPEFAAEVATQKFFEHIPSFRMERRLQNANVNLSRQAIERNVAHLARHLAPIADELAAHAISGHSAHMDETPVRIQAPGEGKCDTGYFWVTCRDERPWNPEAQPAVAFSYSPSRRGEIAQELLEGKELRFLQTDGYAGYNRLYKDQTGNDAMMSVRCWAHVRRKFFETWLATKSPLANRVIRKIRKMYEVERAAMGLPPEKRAALRQEKSLDVLNALHAELLAATAHAEGKLKNAIDYSLNAFEALRHYIFDGRLEIDNNPVERCIRGVALTKKNSLFAGSHESAKVWATYYSLIESARLNRINPRSYLLWLVTEIERTRGEIDHSLLMPWHCPTGHIKG